MSECYLLLPEVQRDLWNQLSGLLARDTGYSLCPAPCFHTGTIAFIAVLSPLHAESSNTFLGCWSQIKKISIDWSRSPAYLLTSVSSDSGNSMHTSGCHMQQGSSPCLFRHQEKLRRWVQGAETSVFLSCSEQVIDLNLWPNMFTEKRWSYFSLVLLNWYSEILLCHFRHLLLT